MVSGPQHQETPFFSVNVFSYRNAKVYWQLCLEPALYNQQSPTRIPGNWSALEGLPRGQRSYHQPTPPNVLSQNTSQATLSSSGALPELQRKQINVRNQYSMNCVIGRKGWEYYIFLSSKCTECFQSKKIKCKPAKYSGVAPLLSWWEI